MKTSPFLSVILAMILMTSTNVYAQKAETSSKTLIAYFSWSGNTRTIAKQIQELTKGDLFEIQTVTPYPKEYRPCTEVAKKEQETNLRPELKNNVDNLADYDLIFIGYPNWWGSAPIVIWTFLESHDLNGKTVIPFCTHGGGGEQNCFKDFNKHIGNANTKKGFLTNGSQAADARPKVEKWLQKTGIIE